MRARFLESNAVIHNPLRLTTMNTLFRMISKPEAMEERSDVSILKNRLDWGRPALTIIDIRDRSDFNARHIVGAVSMPLDDLLPIATASLHVNRDIYVYGDTNEQTAAAAVKLRQAGYKHISELIGGLTAWKIAEYPIEGVSTFFA